MGPTSKLIDLGMSSQLAERLGKKMGRFLDVFLFDQPEATSSPAVEYTVSVKKQEEQGGRKQTRRDGTFRLSHWTQYLTAAAAAAASGDVDSLPYSLPFNPLGNRIDKNTLNVGTTI